jgi:hypothetical protein
VVFKATWRRLAPDEKLPTDAFFTHNRRSALPAARFPRAAKKIILRANRGAE